MDYAKLISGFCSTKKTKLRSDMKESSFPKIVGRTETDLSSWVKLISKEVDIGSGENKIYHAFSQEDYVSTLPVTLQGDVVLVRQFRPAIEDFTLEFPGGTVSKGESSVDAAIRELQEETGYRVQEVQELPSMSPDVGRLTNRFHCFIAMNVLAPVDDWRPEEGVEVVVVPLPKLLVLVKEGEIQNSGHVALLGQAILKGYIDVRSN